MMIILAGGGDPEAVVPIDRYFASVLDPQKTVLYIPIAMEKHVFHYQACYTWFKEIYGGYGITNTELCTDLSTLCLDNRYGAVFIGGGNTFKLLHAIQHSNFDTQIRRYLTMGGILYGGSAGAIVCGKTIEPAICADENRVGVQDYAALNLLNGYDVFCHYHPDEQRCCIEHLQRSAYLLFEDSGVVFRDAAIASVGRPFVLQNVSLPHAYS